MNQTVHPLKNRTLLYNVLIKITILVSVVFMPAWSWKIPTKIQKGNLALRLDQRSAFPRLFGAGVWTNKSADKPKSAAPARLPLHYSRLQHRNLFLNRLITARTIKKLQPPKSEMCNCATEPQHESEGFFCRWHPSLHSANAGCWQHEYLWRSLPLNWPWTQESQPSVDKSCAWMILITCPLG